MGAPRVKDELKTQATGRLSPSAKNHPAVTTRPAATVDGHGRPKFVIDQAALYQAALTHASFEHLGRIFGVSGNMLSKDPEYREIILRARAVKGNELLAAQFDTAIVDHNPTMQIWLGKQYLGQKDVQRVETTGPDGQPIKTELTAKAVAYFPANGRNGKFLPAATASMEAQPDKYDGVADVEYEVEEKPRKRSSRSKTKPAP